ncbi:MAG: FHA domain-containing protein [Rubripirellula sp.]
MSTDHTSGSESSFDHPTDFVVPSFTDDRTSHADPSPTLNDSMESESDTSSDTGLPPQAVGSEAHAGRSVVESPAEVDSIEFRVLRAGAPVRRLRLTGNRYTFGSAEGCSIRLTDHALRPMHAVLIRDQSRILVRAYSVPIDVNGTRKTEAILEVGDILRLGAYQFELLAAIADNPMDSDPALRDVTPTSVDRPSPYDSLNHVMDSSPVKPVPSMNTELPAPEDVIWRDRLRREIDQWRDRQEECDRRESRITDRESDLRSRESELWSRAENLHRRETRVQSQETSAFQLYEDYGQRQQELMQLREQAQTRQAEFLERESEFRSQEFEYRRKLQEATEQLVQSQHQAESATQAVQHMREQFESLNDQIEQLSGQQQDIESREKRQREEHEDLRRNLEIARDQAIDAQAETEARRTEAEARLAEMTAQVERLRAGQGEDLQDQQAKLEASEQLAEQLRQQVDELQKSVVQASDEASQLRTDYEEACLSVRQLESLVEQSRDRGDSDRESWATEADELRTAVDQLSIDLARANGELSELRETNEAITARLDEVQQERDDAIAEVDARPSNTEFQSLREELEAANGQLEQMKQEYDDTLERLKEAEASRQDEIPSDSDSAALLAGVAGMGAIAASALDSDQNAVVDQPAADSSPADDNDDGAWPTYQMPETAFEKSGSDAEVPNERIDPGPESIELDDIQQADWPAADPDPEPDLDLERDDVSSELEADSAGELQVDSYDLGRSDDAPESSVSEDVQQSVWQDSEAPTADPVLEESSEAEVWGATESHEQTAAWNEMPADEVVASDPGVVEPEEEVESTSAWSETPSWQDEAVQESAWPAEDSVVDNEEQGSTMAWDSNESSDWSPRESEAPVEEVSAWENTDDSGVAESSSWSEANDESYPVSAEDAGVDDDAPSTDEIIQGSLASQLIQDFESEPEPSDGTFLMPEGVHASDEASLNQESGEGGWDREFPEEAKSSDWSNSDDGYRVESIEDAGELDQVERSNESDDSSYLSADSSDEDEVAVETSAPEASAELEEDDDDSIEAYMNRLLNRARPGDSPTETASVTQSHLSASVEPSIEENVSELVEPLYEPPMDPDAPLVPRSQAPEKNSDLSAMRELANHSARSAISRSVRIQNRNIQIQGMVNLLCAAGALGCGVACFFLLGGFLQILAIAMTVIIAAVCVREAMAQFAEAKSRLTAAESGELEHENDDAAAADLQKKAENELQPESEVQPKSEGE